MFLYKITNTINNKIYIGYTSRSLSERMASHRFSARNGSTSYLHNAMRKYGQDNFVIELVSEYQTKDEVKQAEIDLIKEIREAGIPNYNLLDGGKGGLYVKDREAWIAKLKVARAGRTPFKGHKHTEETKQKCAEASKRRWNNSGQGTNEP